MPLTAPHHPDDGPLFATGLVVAFFLSAAMLLLQSYL